MTDQELEQKLARAVEHAAPDDLAGVLSRCGERKGKVIPLTTTKKKPGRAVKAAVAACLALVLAGGGGGMYYYQANAVASVVSLDVNPSIELKVNRNEKVLSCAALNEDAAKVLFNMDGGADLVGTKLDVAVNALVGALVRAGYLDSISSAILISVEDKDQSRAEKLQDELTTIVDQALGQGSNTQVLSQVLTQDADPNVPALEDDTQAFQEKYAGVSKGKMSLVMKVMQMNGTIQTNSTYALDALCALSVEELSDLLEYGIMEIPIGKRAACLAAEEYAGTLVLSSVVTGENDVDPEFGDPRPHYEVELRLPNGGEFEYLVDAFTGEVYSGQKDVLNLEQGSEAGGVIGGADGPTNIVTVPSQPQTPTQQTAPVQPAAPAYISAEEAFNAAAAYCSAQHPELDGYDLLNQETERDGDKYEVEFICNGQKFEYDVDARSGAVLKEDTDYRRPEAPTQSDPGVTEAQAKAAAFAHAGCAEGDTSYCSAYLDYDGGVPECWKVEFCWQGNEYEYEVSCGDCSVLDWDCETCDRHQSCMNHHGGGHHGWGHHD